MDLKVYRVPEDERRAGWWTLSIDGHPSLFYSSNEAGINARVVALLEGIKPGAVTLPVARLAAGIQGGDVKFDSGPEFEHWAQLPTVAERIAAFMSRGKLGTRED